MHCGDRCNWKVSIEIQFKTPNFFEKSVEDYWLEKNREDYACFGAIAQDWLTHNQRLRNSIRGDMVTTEMMQKSQF